MGFVAREVIDSFAAMSTEWRENIYLLTVPWNDWTLISWNQPITYRLSPLIIMQDKAQDSPFFFLHATSAPSPFS